MSIFDDQNEYQDGWQDGWDACHKRFEMILKQLQSQPCNIILSHLPLHPSQPNQILEPEDWLDAQGKSR